jgi:uncharacterized protein (DUF433 family)
MKDTAMSVAVVYPHIHKPEGQAARLQRLPRIRVAMIVTDYLAHGWSAEEMCRQHPHLTPAEAHSAMAYYYDHQSEIDDEIQAELTEAERDRGKSVRVHVLK